MNHARYADTILNTNRITSYLNLLTDSVPAVPLCRRLQNERIRGFEVEIKHKGCRCCLPPAYPHYKALDGFAPGLCRRSKSRAFSTQVIRHRALPPTPSITRKPPSLSRPARRLPPNSAGRNDDDHDDDDPSTTVAAVSRSAASLNRKKQEEERQRNQAYKNWERELEYYKRQSERWTNDNLWLLEHSPQDLVARTLYPVLVTYLDELCVWQQKRDEDLTLFGTHVVVTLDQARTAGRLDFVWHEYYTRHLKPVVDEFSTFVDRSLQLERDINELLYTIDWIEWRAQQLVMQHDATVFYFQEMKSEGGDHHQINAIVGKLKDSCEAVCDLIKRSILVGQRAAVARIGVSSYLAIHSTTLCLKSDVVNIALVGHVWRRLNRIHHAQIRLPEIYQETIWSERWDSLTHRLQCYSDTITSMIDSIDVLRAARGAARVMEKASSEAHKHHRSVVRFQRDLANFLNGGYSVLNPAFKSRLGQEMYKYIAPAAQYLQSRVHMRALLRSSKGLKVFAAGTQSTIFANSSTEHREIIALIGRWTHNAVLRLLIDTDHVFTSDVYRQSAGRLACKETRLKAVAQLNHDRQSFMIQDRSSTAIVKSLKGNISNLLYPARTHIPVEYIMHSDRSQATIQSLCAHSIVGFDVVHSNTKHRNGVSYAALASIDRVAVFAVDSTTHRDPPERMGFIKVLLEDPDIVKVTANKDRLVRLLKTRHIFPQSLVNLESTVMTTPKLRIRKIVPQKSTSSGRTSRSALNIHGEGIVNEENALSAIAEVAAMPMSHLIRFLRAVHTPVAEYLPKDLQEDIRENQERLNAMLDPHTNLPPQMGPLVWGEHDGEECLLWLGNFIRAMNIQREGRAPRNLAGFVRALAHSTRVKATGEGVRHGLQTKRTRHLAAYYLFTVFRKDPIAISRLLSLVEPAKAIRATAKHMKLPLHSKDLARLNQAPCDARQASKNDSDTAPESSSSSVKDKISGVIAKAKDALGMDLSTPESTSDSDTRPVTKQLGPLQPSATTPPRKTITRTPSMAKISAMTTSDVQADQNITAWLNYQASFWTQQNKSNTGTKAIKSDFAVAMLAAIRGFVAGNSRSEMAARKLARQVVRREGTRSQGRQGRVLYCDKKRGLGDLRRIRRSKPQRTLIVPYIEYRT